MSSATRLTAALLLLLATGSAATVASHDQAPADGPRPSVAAVEAALDDVWRLLGIESLHQLPLLSSGAMSQLAVPPQPAPRSQPAPAEPAASWVALSGSQDDAWELLRRAQAAEAGPAAAAAATLPARLAAAGSHAPLAEAGAPSRLLPAHPTLTLRFWFERNESTVGLSGRPLSNATFLSLSFSKTRLLRQQPGGGAQELTTYELHLAASMVALACCVLGLLCAALSCCCGREDGGYECDEGCDGDEEATQLRAEQDSSPAFIKAAGYSKL